MTCTPMPYHHDPARTENVPSVSEPFLVRVSHFHTPILQLFSKQFSKILLLSQSLHERTQHFAKTLISALILFSTSIRFVSLFIWS